MYMLAASGASGDGGPNRHAHLSGECLAKGFDRLCFARACRAVRVPSKTKGHALHEHVNCSASNRLQ